MQQAAVRGRLKPKRRGFPAVNWQPEQVSCQWVSELAFKLQTLLIPPDGHPACASLVTLAWGVAATHQVVPNRAETICQTLASARAALQRAFAEPLTAC